MITVDLSDQSIERIAQRVAELLRGAPTVTADVMTYADARAYVKRASPMAFYRWCDRWKVKAKHRGRYGRADLDLALALESGTLHTPATLRRHQNGLRQS